MVNPFERKDCKVLRIVSDTVCHFSYFCSSAPNIEAFVLVGEAASVRWYFKVGRNMTFLTSVVCENFAYLLFVDGTLNLGVISVPGEDPVDVVLSFWCFD